MRTVERFLTSARLDTVWRIVADVEHWHDWTPTILEVKPLTDGGASQGALEAPKLGCYTDYALKLKEPE
jgi:hypothetical protein